jgi:hypothetical protein
MSFQTKQELSSKKFFQATGDTLTLSGQTIISGGLKYNTSPTITGSTQIVHKAYVDSAIADITGSSIIYNGATPASVTVGGITAGYQLTGKTANQILESLLVPTLNPTLTAPSISSFSQNLATTQEVGLSVTPTFTTNFSRGSISPQYTSASPFRSGLPTKYVYGGTGNVRSVASTGTTNTSAATGATVLAVGANTWTVYVAYSAGVQPKDSSGGNFSTPLASGATSNSSTSITGQYIRFYGANATSVTTSSQVRGLPSNAFQTANANTFNLNTGNALTKFIVALPPGRTISSVIDLDALNANITSSYVSLGTISVNTGGGSGSAVNYNLYEMNIGAPYSSSHAHQITTA